jgi:hypothetical protein
LILEGAFSVGLREMRGPGPLVRIRSRNDILSTFIVGNMTNNKEDRATADYALACESGLTQVFVGTLEFNRALRVSGQDTEVDFYARRVRGLNTETDSNFTPGDRVGTLSVGTQNNGSLDVAAEPLIKHEAGRLTGTISDLNRIPIPVQKFDEDGNPVGTLQPRPLPNVLESLSGTLDLTIDRVAGSSTSSRPLMTISGTSTAPANLSIDKIVDIGEGTCFNISRDTTLRFGQIEAKQKVFSCISGALRATGTSITSEGDLATSESDASVIMNVQGARIKGNGFHLKGQYNAIRGYYNCDGKCVTVNATKESLSVAKPTILGGTFLSDADVVGELNTTYAVFLPETTILRNQKPSSSPFTALVVNTTIPVQNLGTVTYQGAIRSTQFQNPSLVSSVTVDKNIDKKLWDI